MFLAAIHNFESLALVSGYGLASGIVVVLLGPWAGRYFVDETKWNRLTTIQLLIAAQNSTTLLSCAVCYTLLMEDLADRNRPLLLALLLVSGPFAVVLSKTITVVMERDWLIVMSGKSSIELSTMNIIMRQIDLTCKIVAPAVAGLMIGPVPLSVAVLIVGSLNVLSLVLESICSVAIYERVPALRLRNQLQESPSGESNNTTDDLMGMCQRCIPRDLNVYLKQRPVSFAGLALSLL